MIAGAPWAARLGQNEILLALGLKRLAERYGVGFVFERMFDGLTVEQG